MSMPRAVRALVPAAAAKRLAFVSRFASTSAPASSTAARRPSRPAGAVKTASPAQTSSSSSASRPIHSTRTAAAARSASPASAATPAPAATPAEPASPDTAPFDPTAPPLPDAAGPAQGPAADPNAPAVDWSASFHGLSTTPFAPEVARVLMTPLDPEDIEIKPDGIIYLPEIKYRRILNLAFGPGGWGLAPRGELAVGEKVVSREFALVVHGRFVGQARGECAYFGGEDGVATAGEGSKSNAMMRCCKDLGVASELWDPRFIRTFKKQYCREVWVEHVVTKKKRQIWLRKDSPPVYPYALATATSSSTSKVVR
ncbi:hypothetical protein SPBR_04363 [Sporothrix brasiliensis 5110]|uniref:Mitochondrial genome maintenance protein MGM101 n=1 Tax=Sporothrix brasiliensis 5110 TaxID=1398154 RepID=A0A0C2F3S8_9PEZI|nr:uncharacterized protein SPBR_04363 [Sporothrix brasiliensis 5110]KIH93574.1 hypothetical protein SPBR_04363 [Sporothrix brasiliensis 5110]